MRVAVLGAGSWGTTLAILLAYNGHGVTLWSHREDHTQEMIASRENAILLPGIKIPDSITITSDLLSAVKEAGVIVAAVPSQFLRSAAKKLSTVDFHDVLFVNVAK